jgi:hypothetical protein
MPRPSYGDEPLPEPLFRPHNTPPFARPPTLGSTALRANYRGGTWFESTAAHQVPTDMTQSVKGAMEGRAKWQWRSTTQISADWNRTS